MKKLFARMLRKTSDFLKSLPEKKEKARQVAHDTWANMDGQSRTLFVLMVLGTFAAISISASQGNKSALEEQFAKVDKIQNKGILLPTDNLFFNGDSALRTAKKYSEATIVEFVNAKKARGPVDKLRLVKTDQATYPFLLEVPEEWALRELLKSKDRIDSLRFVDFETLPSAEKDAIQGLALRLAPPDYREEAALMDQLLGAANLLLTCLMLGYILQMIRQGQKSLKFIRPNKIQGELSDLVGMDDIKTEVMRVKDFLANRASYKEYGVERPNNILFSGPPGTGKTKLAGYLAKELGLPILFHSAANLETGFVNGGAQTLEKALALAKKEKRCVIFLDEAQDLFMKRGQSGRKFDDDTQNTLLSILDGVRTTKDSEIIWIVASNFNSNTMEQDEAMLRRFQMKIDFRLPNPEERGGIFEFYLRKAGGKLAADLQLESAIQITEQCSPADIESIAHEAGVAAINQKSLITTDILIQASERHLIGNTDEATTKGRERDREIIAIHEVGHFLIDAMRHCQGDLAMAPSAKDKVGSIKISLKANARSNALGFVLKKPSTHMLATKRDMEWEIMTLFGGMANEELFFGEDGVTGGAYNDIQEVTKLLGRAVTGMGLYKDAKINFSVLSNPRDGTALTDEDREAMKRASSDLFAKAKNMLKMHKELSKILADALVEKLEMKSSEMLDLIGAHCSPKPSEPAAEQ